MFRLEKAWFERIGSFYVYTPTYHSLSFYKIVYKIFAQLKIKY
nr:MAG TPA: hypothetical protein [Caudoviricetes sp.]